MLNSHTHYQAAQANAQTQAWQRVQFPKHTIRITCFKLKHIEK
jgi:hypothetical protein